MKILHTSDWYLGQKFILLVTCLFLSSSSIYGQTGIDSENLYTKCLLSFLDTFTNCKAYKVGDTAFVFKTDYLPTYSFDYNGVFIHTINADFIYNRTRKRKTIQVIEVQPISFNDGEAILNVAYFGVSRRRRHYTQINNGHQRQRIIYDCDKRKFIYEFIGNH